MSRDNLNNVEHKATRHFRNKKLEYLIDKSNNLETNIKNKNTKNLHAGINEFKKCYEPETNLVKVKEFDLRFLTTFRKSTITSLSYCMYMGLILLG